LDIEIFTIKGIANMRFILIITSIIFSINSAIAQTSGVNRPYFADSTTQLLYHFNETSGATVAVDDSGKMDSNGTQRRDGSYNGLSAATTALGNTGMLFFDSAIKTSTGLNNRVTWTHQGQSTTSFLYPKPNSSFTIEGWFKLTDTSFTHAVTLFTVQPQGSANPDYQLLIMPPNDASRPLGLVFADTQAYRAYTGALTWTANTWYHIAVVVQQTANSATYTLYRTPQSSTSTSAVQLVSMTGSLMQPVPSATDSSDRVFSIGNYYGDNGADYFHGLIDEVRFSTKARTTSDFELTIAPTVADNIRVAATTPNSETDHALPLTGSWVESSYAYINGQYLNPPVTDPAHYGYSPTWQLEQIANGHYLLPWFTTPSPDLNYASAQMYANYYSSALQSAATQNLPISFLGVWTNSNAQPQWEAYLYTNSQYLNAATSTNPNLVCYFGSAACTPGVPIPLLSAFGYTGAWNEVGASWGGGSMLGYLQGLYPNPPKVLFLSNNEAHKETWTTDSTLQSCTKNGVTTPCPIITDDQHYYDVQISPTDPDDVKIKNTGNAWASRYRFLQSSWNGSLTSNWQLNSKFVAYNAFGPAHYGRWGGWKSYSLSYDLGNSDHRIDPTPISWDGASAQQYCGNGNGADGTVSDDKVYSAEIESMNFEFMRQEALHQNPNFWFELSTWNGCDTFDVNGHPTCAGFSAAYTPQRYAGSVQFGMWLLRPRVVRDYRVYTSSLSATQSYFNSVMASVDKIYSNATLQSFWRNSQLVSAEAANYTHPYQQNLLTSYSGVTRMYLLQASVNPPAPTSSWALTAQINVFAMARVRGNAGAHKWLVYAFSPDGAQKNVSVLIPGYKDNYGNDKSIVINSSIGGSFYLIDEKQSTVTAL